MSTLDAIARAVGTNQVDAAILPARYARELLAANHAKLVGWYWNSTSNSWVHCLSPVK